MLVTCSCTMFGVDEDSDAVVLQGISDRQLNGAAAPTAADGTSDEGPRQNGAAQPQPDGQQLDAQQPGFVPLDETSLVDFIAAKPHLAERLGGVASKSTWKVLSMSSVK
jgi:hypothetical protein